MNDLLSKISSYHLFNYLLPGCLLAVLAKRAGHPYLMVEPLVAGLFAYYFYGLIISRLSSLLIEPLLKATRFLRFSDYSDYVAACKKDSKIDVLSETNNMYRTLCGLPLSLGLLNFHLKLVATYPSMRPYEHAVIWTGLTLILLFSYRKQTEYIAKRVMANKDVR